MGSDISGAQYSLRITNDWIFVQQNHQYNNKIVRSSQGILGEQYTQIFNNAYDIHDQMEIYRYRRDQDKSLVKVLAAQIQHLDHGSICGTNQMIKIITQKIAYRLESLNNLSFPESLYLFSQCMIGFHEIYKKVGPIQITNKMIALTPEGFARVWLNQNFSQNHPTVQKNISLQMTDYRFLLKNPKKYEIDMIINLLQLIEQHTSNGFPREFKQEIEGAKDLDFAAVQMLLLEFIDQNHIFVEDRIIVEKPKPLSSSSFSNIIQTVEEIRYFPEVIVETPVRNLQTQKSLKQIEQMKPMTPNRLTLKSTFTPKLPDYTNYNYLNPPLNSNRKVAYSVPPNPGNIVFLPPQIGQSNITYLPIIKNQNK